MVHLSQTELLISQELVLISTSCFPSLFVAFLCMEGEMTWQFISKEENAKNAGGKSQSSIICQRDENNLL